jgi:tetratricopeptide (TPR) repeat protein
MNPTAHYILARSFLRMGAPERALASIRKALAGGPDRKEYLYFKGQVLSRMGRNLDALSAFQRVYFLDSHYRKTAQYIEKLNK